MELVEVTYTDIIDNYLASFKENMSVKDVVYRVIKDNLIDKKALRNRCIVADFDKAYKKNGKGTYEIYDDLAFIYNISLEMVRKIVAQR